VRQEKHTDLEASHTVKERYVLNVVKGELGYEYYNSSVSWADEHDN
jgi:uncharacterized protein (DUF2164 family)